MRLRFSKNQWQKTLSSMKERWSRTQRGGPEDMTTNWGELSAKAIITKLKAKKEVKYSRRYHCHYSEIEVALGKRSVKLFKRSAALRENAQTA